VKFFAAGLTIKFAAHEWPQIKFHLVWEDPATKELRQQIVEH
jgi:hypothetical protein